MECWACGGRTWRPLFEKAGWAYVACPTCGLARLDPVPSHLDAVGRFHEGYFRAQVATGPTAGYHDYVADAALHRRNARRRLAAARRLVPGAASVLDVGCATGFLLDEAAVLGWRVAGVEPSAWSRQHPVGAHLPIVEHLDDVEGTFDVVTSLQVLEHLVDPLTVLRQLRDRVRPGGVLLVESWLRDSEVGRLLRSAWSVVTPPSVVTLFTRDSLRLLVERAGFEDVRVRRTTKTVSVGAVSSLVGEEHPRLEPVLAAARQVGLDRVPVRYALGDLALVTARG